MRKCERDERVLHGGKIGEGVGNIDMKQKRLKSRETEREEDRGNANNLEGEKERN